MSSTRNYKFWEKGWWGETSLGDKMAVFCCLLSFAIVGFYVLTVLYKKIKNDKTAAQTKPKPKPTPT